MLRRIAFGLCLSLLLPALALAAEESAGDKQAGEQKKKTERISIAVMEFSTKGGVEQSQMESLSDLLANQVRDMGNFKVIGKADIQAALQLQETKTVLGCNDETCLAEIGGALGVRYMIFGNIGLFGSTYLLNLKLLDVEKVEVTKGVSRSIGGAEDQLVATLPEAAAELMSGLEGVEGVELKQTELKSAGEKKPRPKGWFVAPGDRKGDFQVTVYLGGILTTPPVLKNNEVTTDSGTEIYFEDLESTSGGGWFSLAVGYCATNWLTISARLGATIATATESSRQRNALEAVLSFQGSMMNDSWFQPMAYFDMGLVAMQDRSDESKAEVDQRIETLGIQLNLGIGANMYATSSWFIGARLGGCVRAHIMLEHNTSASKSERVSGARATEMGVTMALVTGYEF